MDRGPLRFSRLERREVAGVVVPVAAGPLSRLLGLALLAHARAGPGLLIPGCRAIHTFGMRFPIDVVFLDGEGRVIRRLHAVPPGRAVRERRAMAVLELAATGVASPARRLRRPGSRSGARR